MSMDALKDIAKSLNAPLSEEPTTLIYNIIDAESEQVSQKPAPKKKREKKSAVPQKEVYRRSRKRASEERAQLPQSLSKAMNV